MSENRLAIRSEWASFMNTGTAIMPTWSRIGEGFTDFELTYSANEYTAHYIHEKTERTAITGYAPEFSFTCDVFTQDPVIREIMKVVDDELIGTEAVREIVSCNLYEPINGQTDTYPAFTRKWSIIPGSKGSGVDALILSGTFSAFGDSVRGTFNTKTLTFTPIEE